MNKNLLLALLFTSIISFAQKDAECELKTLSPIDELNLSSLPKLTLDQIKPVSKNKSLPYAVDNSQKPYFRPVFSQSSLDCGQASSVGLCFASEINFKRGVSGTVPDNQYPTFFTYNFQNDGVGAHGVSYFHSFEILKKCGTPNSVYYGGMYNGDDTVWMSGYDKYYHAMHNRLIEAYTIEVTTPEGLEVLKRWINDHGDGSEGGGFAVFYAQCCGASATLPAGTEEAGKYCHPYWSPSPNHAMTIVGYNDSIRYDFNGDGQYTNDIDINGDGIVDLKDWEIGGLKYCNTYAGGPSWANGGFCYMFYKGIADDLGEGGIWNHSVQVLKPQADCQPLLTMKATVTYNKRKRIKIYAGYSTNTSATTPEYVMDFPVFNFQGGDFYMQGGSTIPAYKTLELGLDITPFLNTIEPGQDIKYFLIIDEVDGDGSGTGEVVSFSVIDYTSGIDESVCSSVNVPIVNNGQTLLSVVKNVSFSPINITTDALPDITVYEDYNFQMEAENGNDPYSWDIILDYPRTEISESFPASGSTVGTINSYGYFIIELPFEFMYYDIPVNKISVLDNGIVFPHGDLIPWPYYKESRNFMFHKYKMIAPLFSDNIGFYGSQSDEISYSMNSDSITIVFDASYASDYSDVKFALRIDKDGNIKYFYGAMPVSANLDQIIGISEGDHFNSYLFDESLAEISGKGYLFSYPDYPKGMQISTEGLFHGSIDQPYLNVPITFEATDENHLKNRKTLYVSTNGLIIDYTVNAGSNGIVDFGESINLDIGIFNTYPDDLTGCNMVLSSSDPYINITDNTENIGTLTASMGASFPSAFSIDISEDIPDNHIIPLTCTVTSGVNSWARNFSITGRAPVVEIIEYTIDDGGDNLLDPGESADIYVTFKNFGGSKAENINLDFSTLDPNITINSVPVNPAIAVLEPDGTETVVLNITVDGSSPTGHIVQMDCGISADNGYLTEDVFYFGIGLIIEDFETGDMETFSWHTSGDAEWFVTDELPYEGAYCMKSGDISDLQETSLKLVVEVLQSGNISFFKKVSCEDGPSENYDYLAFLIDDIQQGKWDAEIPWSEETFPVSAGVHTFEWVYVKDVNVSSGEDCAWVDYITFPPILNSPPVFAVNPDSIVKILPPDVTDSDTISLANIGGGIVDYQILINYAAVSGGSKSEKSIAGSTVQCEQSFVYTGALTALTFSVHNASPDNEWIKDLYITIPAGVNLDTCTFFVGGSGGEMAHDSVFGENVTVHWHGEDGSGWGVLHSGETAYATLFLTVDPLITTDISFVYTIMGEVYGADPHVIVSSLSLDNYGEVEDWISVDHIDGSISMGENNDLIINYDTWGLDFGTYYCELLIENTFNDVFVVPVTLIVIDPLSVEENSPSSGVVVYPNPFTNSTTIGFTLVDEMTVNLNIYNMLGEKVKTFSEVGMPKGLNQIQWDGTNDFGREVAEGTYFFKLEYGTSKFSGNLIIVK